MTFWEFPGGPVVASLFFHWRGPWFHPWRGTKILQAVQWGQGKKLHFLVSILKSTVHEVIVGIPEFVI